MGANLAIAQLQDLALKLNQRRDLTAQDLSIIASVLFHLSKSFSERILRIKEITPHMVHFTEEVFLQPGSSVKLTAWNSE